MKRSILPVVLTAALFLSACGSIPSRNQVSDPSPVPATAPAPVPDSTPAPSPSPEPASPAPVPAPTPKPPSGTGHGASEPTPAKPAVTWMPRDIGLPLVPSDPAAAGQKVAMLTFDDGPSENTVSILETLAKEKAKAIFFITGYNAKNHPALVERIHKEGHILGIHTMTHPNLRTLPKEGQRKEIEPLVTLIEQVSGKKPRYLRPPFGAYNDDLRQLLKEMNLELINWTNGSLDWEGVVNGYKDPKLVVADVMRQLHPGAVILMHDTNKHTAEALPEIIRQIRAEGYEFVTLP